MGIPWAAVAKKICIELDLDAMCFFNGKVHVFYLS